MGALKVTVTKMLMLKLRAWFLWHRLRHAKAYRAGLERTIRVERQRAEGDVEHCEIALARAHFELARAQVVTDCRS